MESDEKATEEEYADAEVEPTSDDPNIYVNCTVKPGATEVSYKFSPRNDGKLTVSTFVEESNEYKDDALYARGWYVPNVGYIAANGLYAETEPDFIYIWIAHKMMPYWYVISRKTGVMSRQSGDKKRIFETIGTCSASENMVQDSNQF